MSDVFSPHPSVKTRRVQNAEKAYRILVFNANTPFIQSPKVSGKVSTLQVHSVMRDVRAPKTTRGRHVAYNGADSPGEKMRARRPPH